MSHKKNSIKSKIMNEQNIISRIQDNDEETLRYLYIEMRHPITAMLIKNGAGKEDAMDIFQDALIAFYRNVQNKKISGDSIKIKNYLYAISRNLWLNRLRKQPKRFLEEVPSISESPESIYIENENSDEMKKNLELALSKMSERCQKLISDYYLDQKSNEEIARELGFKNANSSRVMKHRCLRQLREIFREQLEEQNKNK